MPRNTRDVVNKMATKYVEARIAGRSKKESKRIAGYAPTTKIQNIERPGGPVANKMVEALEAHGITEERIAAEYAEGLEKSKQPGAREADFNSHSKYLLQLAYLKGYGKKDAPAVALQINTGTSREDDSGRLEGFAERLDWLLGALEKEIGRREPGGLHAGDPGDQNSQAHS